MVALESISNGLSRGVSHFLPCRWVLIWQTDLSFNFHCFWWGAPIWGNSFENLRLHGNSENRFWNYCSLPTIGHSFEFPSLSWSPSKLLSSRQPPKKFLAPQPQNDPLGKRQSPQCSSQESEQEETVLDTRDSPPVRRSTRERKPVNRLNLTHVVQNQVIGLKHAVDSFTYRMSKTMGHDETEISDIMGLMAQLNSLFVSVLSG